jgi:hypothetical protein
MAPKYGTFVTCQNFVIDIAMCDVLPLLKVTVALLCDVLPSVRVCWSLQNVNVDVKLQVYCQRRHWNSRCKTHVDLSPTSFNPKP